MNFQNVDIPVLAKFISEITGKNFVLDESVRGKVSIISPTKVTPSPGLFDLSVRSSVKGLHHRHRRLDYQDRAGARCAPVRRTDPSQQPGDTQGDQYVTRMVKLQNADSGSVMSVIQPMISHDGLVAAFPQDNTSDHHRRRFQRAAAVANHRSLDVQSIQHNVAVIPLKLAFC